MDGNIRLAGETISINDFIEFMQEYVYYEKHKKEHTIIELNKFSIFDFLTKNQNKKADKNNFNKNSFAIFSDVDAKKEKEIRGSKADYIRYEQNNDPTLYWFKDEGIYRLSAYWGGDIMSELYEPSDWYFCNDNEAELDTRQEYDEVCFGNVVVTDRLLKKLTDDEYDKMPSYFVNEEEAINFLRSSPFLPEDTVVEPLLSSRCDSEFSRWEFDIYGSSEKNIESYLIEDEEAKGGRLGFVKFEDIMFKDALKDYIESFFEEDWYEDWFWEYLEKQYYGDYPPIYNL